MIGKEFTLRLQSDLIDRQPHNCRHGLIQMPPLHLIGSLEYLSPADKKTEDIKLLTFADHVGSVIAKFVFD